jgi:hypothetical protein
MGDNMSYKLAYFPLAYVIAGVSQFLLFSDSQG